MKTGVYKAKPLQVEAAYYDGTLKSATEFCEKWPNNFSVGEDKHGNFAGLYIMLKGGGMVFVHPDEVVYKEVDGDFFCSVDKNAFDKYFVRSKRSKIVVATEILEEI